MLVGLVKQGGIEKSVLSNKFQSDRLFSIETVLNVYVVGDLIRTDYLLSLPFYHII